MALVDDIPYSAYQPVVEAYLKGFQAEEATRKAVTGFLGLASSLALVATGVGSVAGLYGAGASLFSLLDATGSGKPDRFLILAETLQRIDDKLSAYITWSVNAQWDSLRTDFREATNSMHDYVAGTATPGHPPGALKSDDNRADFLRDVIVKLRTVRERLLPEGNESTVYQQSQSHAEYGLTPTSLQFFERVNPADVQIGGLPAGQQQALLTGAANLMWDYRRAVIYMMPALSQLVAAYRFIDPAFRTTGRFKDELEKTITSLEIFAARWASVIVWSKLGLDDDGGTFSGLDFPAAYDVRSWVFYCLYTQNPNVAFAPPIPNEPNYSNRRREYANIVTTVTGLRDFHDSIARLKALLTLPAESESVACDTTITGWRRFERKRQIVHDRVTRNVKVYHVDWLIKCAVRVQPQLAPYDYAAGYPIKYKFFLESHHDTLSGWTDQPIQKVELKPKAAAQQIVIKVNSPELYVAVEDDGTFGPAPRGGVIRRTDRGRANPGQVVSKVPSAPAAATHEVVAVYAGKAASNDGIKKYAKALGGMLALQSVSGPPARAHYQYPSLRNATIGVAFHHGPANDIRAGLVQLEAWNLDGHDENVGALFFVIEEYPPAEPGSVIRTMVHLPINPTEYWTPGFSRMTPGYIPVTP